MSVSLPSQLLLWGLVLLPIEALMFESQWGCLVWDFAVGLSVALLASRFVVGRPVTSEHAGTPSLALPQSPLCHLVGS